jgi:hypothetical protein
VHYREEEVGRWPEPREPVDEAKYDREAEVVGDQEWLSYWEKEEEERR